MAKQDVIKAVHEKMGGTVSQENIGKVLDATFGAMKTLNKDQSCRINDFGTFKVKERAARKGAAVGGKGKTIDIPARLAMTFKMATKFKESLNAPKKAAKKATKKKK